MFCITLRSLSSTEGHRLLLLIMIVIILRGSLSLFVQEATGAFQIGHYDKIGGHSSAALFLLLFVQHAFFLNCSSPDFARSFVPNWQRPGSASNIPSRIKLRSRSLNHSFSLCSSRRKDVCHLNQRLTAIESARLLPSNLRQTAIEPGGFPATTVTHLKDYKSPQ